MMISGRVPSLVDPFLYVIGAEKKEPIKIGIAECPIRRLADLQTAHFHELFILAEGQIGGAYDEQQVHELFGEHRLRGEWFSRSREIVDFIEMLSSNLGVYQAAANVLKSRETRRPLHPHERRLQQWAVSNMPQLGPRPVPPPTPTQADADRFANSIRRAGLPVTGSRIENGQILVELACGPNITISNSAIAARR